MKRKVILILTTSLLMVGCGNSVQNNSNKEAYEDLKSKYEILNNNYNNLKEEYAKLQQKVSKANEKKTDDNKVFGKGEYWEVEGQWKLKIDSVTPTDYRNQFSDKNPEQVVIIKYTYENLGYTNDIQDLYIRPRTVIDSNKKVCELYPADTQTSPKPTPVGAICEGAEIAYGLSAPGGKIKIKFEKYDSNRVKRSATFEVEVE